jgi:hypothetical protein
MLVFISRLIPGKETWSKTQKSVRTNNSHLIPHVPEPEVPSPSSYHGPQHLMRCVKKEAGRSVRRVCVSL